MEYAIKTVGSRKTDYKQGFVKSESGVIYVTSEEPEKFTLEEANEFLLENKGAFRYLKLIPTIVEWGSSIKMIEMTKKQRDFIVGQVELGNNTEDGMHFWKTNGLFFDVNPDDMMRAWLDTDCIKVVE